MHRKLIIVIGLLTMASVFFLQCVRSPVTAKDPRGEQFAGSASCMGCHKNIFDTYILTPHFNTSEQTSFTDLKNKINTHNNKISFINNQTVRLEKKNETYFQRYYKGDKLLASESMDITFGSGEKAQTFAYWKDQQLFELPLTYLHEMNLWTNSPGFPANQPYYSRMITGKCLECHSSFAQKISVKTGAMKIAEKLNPNTIILGIDCERCHGAAAQHVQFHTDHPGEKKAEFMKSISALTRQQQLDGCATCHSGDQPSMQSLFNFKPGDKISDYFIYYPGSRSDPDVHGMQMQSLQLSECFKQSTLTCVTCHSPHLEANNNRGVFIAGCISCHQPSAHVTQMQSEKGDCITCHMPLRNSKSLDFNNSTENKAIPYRLRTHRIAIYPKTEWQ